MHSGSSGRRQNNLPFVTRECKGPLRPPQAPALAFALTSGCCFLMPPPPAAGVRCRAVPARPCCPLPAGLPPRPAAAVGGVFVVFSNTYVPCGTMRGVYVRFCFRFWFPSWCGRCRPSAVLWLGVGSSGLAWRGGVASGASLSVRAVRLVFFGFLLCAFGVGLGLACLGASGGCGFADLVGLWLAGSPLCGQGGAAVWPFLPRGLCRLAAGSRSISAGGAGCLNCLALWRWQARGFFPRPVPPWWFRWHRPWPAAAILSRLAAAWVRMRRCCRRFPALSRRLWCAAWPRSVLVAPVPVPLLPFPGFPHLPVLAV